MPLKPTPPRRRRPIPIDKVDELRAVERPVTAETLSRRFLRRLQKWAGDDPEKWRAAALLSLYEEHAWDRRMLSLLFGLPAESIGEHLVAARQTVPNVFAQHWNHDDNGNVAVSLVDGETLLDRLHKVRQFLKQDDHELDDAIEQLRIGYSKRREDEL